jgi:hypothetical protein
VGEDPDFLAPERDERVRAIETEKNHGKYSLQGHILNDLAPPNRLHILVFTMLKSLFT